MLESTGSKWELGGSVLEWTSLFSSLCFRSLSDKARKNSVLNYCVKPCSSPLHSHSTGRNMKASITCFAVSSSPRSSLLALSMVQATFRRLLTLKSSRVLCPWRYINQLHSTCKCFPFPPACRRMRCKGAGRFFTYLNKHNVPLLSNTTYADGLEHLYQGAWAGECI